jgi:hypothetical protein
MLTDTTFWIDLLQERERGQRGGATRFIESHQAHEVQVSIVTWGELAEGFTNPHELSELCSVEIISLTPRFNAVNQDRAQGKTV